MKLYAITSGEYSDYGIIALTADYEKAKRIVEIWNKEKGKYEDDAEIEEYEDGEWANTIELYDANYHKYKVEYDAERKRILGITEVFILTEPTNKVEPEGLRRWVRTVNVVAKDEESAIKVAKDYLMKYFAEEQGI